MKWYLEVARKYAVFNGRSHGKTFGLSLFSLAHLLPIISIDIGKTLETDINLTTLLKTHKIVPLNDNYTNSQEGNADSDAKSLLIKSKICLLFQ